MDLLDDLTAVCEPGRRVSVARELTKVHEEFVRGTLPEAAAYYREKAPRGEVTVVVGPADPAGLETDRTEEAIGLAKALLREDGRPSGVARELVKRLGLARNEAYRIVHDLEGTATEE